MIGRLLVPGELRVSVVSAFLGAPVLIWLVRRQPRGRWPVIAPSRRLIASCLLLMAASLLISLLGLAQGPVPLTIDGCSRRCSAMRRATSRWW